MTYIPDNWVIIKLKGIDPHYRVLAGWSGGYTTGDSWRLNSGITNVTEDDMYYYFSGVSGSVYQCHKNAYCLRKNVIYAWHELQQLYGGLVELMTEDTDWLSVDWEL